MRAPRWFKQELADQGGLILERAVTEEQAADTLAGQILAKDERFARQLVADYVRKQLRTWISQHAPAAALEDPDAQLDLFPEIPRRLEVAPGRFADQAVMNRHDWECALRQAKTKASNASGYADAIRQAYDKVRPLLTNDELTTADVWKPRGQATGGSA